MYNNFRTNQINRKKIFKKIEGYFFSSMHGMYIYNVDLIINFEEFSIDVSNNYINLNKTILFLYLCKKFSFFLFFFAY